MRQITAAGDTGDNQSSSSNLELWKQELRSKLRRKGVMVGGNLRRG